MVHYDHNQIIMFLRTRLVAELWGSPDDFYSSFLARQIIRSLDVSRLRLCHKDHGAFLARGVLERPQCFLIVRLSRIFLGVTCLGSIS